MPVYPCEVENDKFVSARYGTASRLWGKRIDVSGRISNEISSANAKCQKCLEKGHWSYQCQGKRKILERATRTKQYETDMKRLKSGLPLVPKTAEGSAANLGTAGKQPDALERLKAQLDEESSSSSDGESGSASSESSSGSSSTSDSSSSSSNSESSSKRKKAKRRKVK